MSGKAGLGMVAAVLLCTAGPSPTLATTDDRDRLTRCFLDDPARYIALVERMRAESTREHRVRLEDTDEGRRACDITEESQSFPEEVALPMPCGLRMLLRRVRTPGGSPLDQAVGYFGDLEASETGDTYLLSTAPWDAPVAGAFHDGGGNAAYYIGKYEVTAPQWGVFEAGLFDRPPDEVAPGGKACTAFTESHLSDETGRPLKPVKVYPATNVNWFDAIAFSRAYSNWLILHDQIRIRNGKAPVTPWNNGAPGFLRLPTEEEWEFAARGGEAGKEGRSKRLHDLFDEATGQSRRAASIDEIAYVESVQNQSLVDGVGRRAPNVRHIYDMVGNVEEIALNLFRMVRPDGLHGQLGGYVVRGGSSVTPLSEIGVGVRREIPLLDRDGINRSRFVGFRLLLSAPVFTASRGTDGSWEGGGGLDRSFAEGALAARQELTQAGGGESNDRSRLLQDLAALRSDTKDDTRTKDELLDRLAELQTLLETSNAEILESRNNALRDRAVSSMAIAWGVRQTGQRLYVGRREIKRLVESFEQSGKSHSEIRQMEEKANGSARRISGELDAQYALYVEAVQELAELTEDQLKLVLTAARSVVENRGADAFGDAPAWLTKHAMEADANNAEITEEMRRRWLFEVDEYRQRRVEKFGELR